MKCDELKVSCYTTRSYNTIKVYDKEEVDEAIAELKDKLHDIDDQWNEQCKEIAELKAENESLKAKLESVQATAYADSVDAGMRERRLRRALWLTRWFIAIVQQKYIHADWYTGFEKDLDFWENVEKYCRATAEEYK